MTAPGLRAGDTGLAGDGAAERAGITPLIRRLPPVAPRWRQDADVVVVGSGAAGITAALTAAARGLRVLLVTKELSGGASPLAQGGLAAAIGPGDSPGQHACDTMTAGVGLCDPETVIALTGGSPDAVGWLVARGARLERRDLRLEGGHSHRRIVHSGDDASGAEVHRALLMALLASAVTIVNQAVALDLVLRPDGSTAGLAVLAGPGAGLVAAPAVVLAAGGLGQAFATTSNPAGATGDAIAIAARAGALLRDLEFVQFHPTVLWSDGATGQRPLITEALRGAGAVLRDPAGDPVMAGRHPRGDLAPRDIVAAAMFDVLERERAAGAAGQHLWLDATGLGRATVEDGFPTVTAACRAEGIDPVTALIPVAPGAHYSCGGVAAGLDGRTSVPGLYAVGEAASTGVHGANRLASNSLVEAVLMGHSVAESILADLERAGGQQREWAGGAACPAGLAGNEAGGGAGLLARPDRNRREQHGCVPVHAWLDAGQEGMAAAARADLAGAMSRCAGVVRDRDGLLELLRVAAAAPAAAIRDRADGLADAGLNEAGAAGWPTARAGSDRTPAWRPGSVGVAVTDDAAASSRGGIALDTRAAGGRQGRPWVTATAAAAGAAGRWDAAQGVPAGRIAAAYARDAAGTGAIRNQPLDRAVVAATNLHAVSVLIAASALARTESRGCHRRRDAPRTWPGARHTLLRASIGPAREGTSGR
ncbi:MAG TPA: FAD-binding protein [Trebonia sp.]|jgi:L-aspartate oxidase|nr:FAD-binding protein [Trebonia sp.]